MEPIINPWFVYLLELVNSIKNGTLPFLIISSMALIVYLVGTNMVRALGSDSEKEKWTLGWKKIRIPLFIIFSITISIQFFIPSRNTLIGMYAAKMITYNNVEKALTEGKALKDEVKADFIEILKTITQSEENNNEN